MFTGIIEEVGSVVEVGRQLRVSCRTVGADSDRGASVAVNGVCLTVVGRERHGDAWDLDFDLSVETLDRTSLGSVDVTDPVNLERAATLLTRLGGHLVQGHVDGVGLVSELRDGPAGRDLRIKMPEGIDRYVAPKGSIAVDGVSLTVTDISGGDFGVALIPYTLRTTTLGTTKVGDRLNLEVDVVAKYVEGLLRGST